MRLKAIFFSLIILVLLVACNASNEEGQTNNNIEQDENESNEEIVQNIEFTNDEAMQLVYDNLNDINELIYFEVILSSFYNDNKSESIVNFEEFEGIEAIVQGLNDEERDKTERLFEDTKNMLVQFVADESIDEVFEAYLLAQFVYDVEFIDSKAMNARFSIEEQTEDELVVSFIRFMKYSDEITSFRVVYEKDKDNIKFVSYDTTEIEEITPKLTFDDITYYWGLHDPDAKINEVETTDSYIKYTIETNYFDISSVFERTVGNDASTGEIITSFDDVFRLLGDGENIREAYVRPTEKCEDDLYVCYKQKIKETTSELDRRSIVGDYTSDASTAGFNASVYESYEYYDQILLELVDDLDEYVADWDNVEYEEWLDEREATMDELNDPNFGTLAPADAYLEGNRMTEMKTKQLMDTYLKENK